MERAVEQSGGDSSHPGSIRSLSSDIYLTGHAAAPAGYGSTTNQAPTLPDQGGGQGTSSGNPVTGQPPHQPFYKKRWFITTQIVMIPLGIALLFILLFPVVKAIVKLVIGRTTLDIQQAIITSPQNNTFNLKLQGWVYHTGIIPAKIMFTEPAQVYWIENSTTQTHLGTMQLHDLSAKNKRALINDTTSFQIIDEDAFGRFSGALITSNNFTWRLVSNNLRVRAASFPVSTGLSFDKEVTMNGFDNFDGDATLIDLQLPQDNPGGGIDFRAVTQLYNPSPFTMDLGTVIFSMAYKNVTIGVGTGTGTKLGPGNNTITLTGTLQPHTRASDLSVVSELFTRYLNGEPSPVIATGLSTQQLDGSTVSWLSQGLQSLTLTVPFKSLIPTDPIRSVKIGDMALQFDTSQAWTPAVESHSVRASMELPFGFNVSIDQIENSFVISQNAQDVAGLQTPSNASTSSIHVLSKTSTAGTIDIVISNTRLSCPDAQHPAFSSFNKDLTVSDVAEFRLIGESKAYANTSLGQIYLNPIKVNVSTTLNGLRGLRGLTTIENVDVTGGTADGIQLGIGVNIMNPSSLNLSTGDLALRLLRNATVLGTATMPNLVLRQGNNSIRAVSTFQANDSPEGLQTLNDFVGKKDVHLTIAGYDGSTQVASLSEAFKAISLDVVLPALKTNLLDSAALTILSTTGRTNNISHVAVTLNNPFSVALEITKVSSKVSYKGIPLGTIEQDVDFKVAPNSTTKSPDLNLDMNFAPAALFTVTRALGVKAGLDVKPLDAIVSLGGYEYLTTSTQQESVRSLYERQADLFKGFDLTTFVKTAFKQLSSDVQLTTGLKIGDYQTTIGLTQPGVPTATDDTLTLILPILAAPVVQKIVSGSTLGLDSVLIKDPQQLTFQTEMKGGIRNAGPFDATISFPSGLVISWNGKPIGSVSMADVQVVGDVGATISTESKFEVTDVDHLTNFTKTLLTTESFDWEISASNLTVKALGISVSGITLPARKVTLKGFNGLKDDVKIVTFDLPSNDPAGGIHLDLQTSTTNPSQIGIQLSSIAFNTYYGDILIGPVASNGQVTLAPSSTTSLSLAGRLVPQSTAAGLAAVSEIFNNFMQGKDSDVVVHGASAGPSGVTWLNQGFQVLQIATVLPNRGVLDIIKSIALNELTLIFTPQTAFNPDTGSKTTDAVFTLPFAFPIDIVSLRQTITLGYQGTDFAQLAIPKGPSKTDVQSRIIHLSFQDVPLTAFDNQHATFEEFLTATTVDVKQTVRLSGSADADASTAVGLLSLKGIKFSVDTDIAGLQALNVRPATVSNLDVNHGYPDYLLLKVDSGLFNPSNLTIGTGDVSFGLEFQGQTVGSADLSDLVIIPGNASYKTDVHYSPHGSPAALAGKTMLQNFLQGIDSDVTIAGSQSSTQVTSLQDALSHIRLSPVKIPALHQNLINSTSLTFPVDIAQTGTASASFVLDNPFTASINLLKTKATATYQGLTLGEIPNVDMSNQPVHAGGHSSATSSLLPFEFNLDPAMIIQLLLQNSKANGVDLGPLVSMFQFIIDNPEYKPAVKTSTDPNSATCVSGQQFDAFGAILKSLANLKVDLTVDASVKLDDFATDLSFTQKGVPAITDKTSLYLISAVAGPVAQHLVDGSVLTFSAADISNVSEDGFDLALKGSLTNTGPLDALIAFTEPVTVTWQGKNIAQITLSPICAAANVGVPNYETNAKLRITDKSAFTDFATYLLHNPSFDWTISTSKLRLTALGTIFDDVSLTKTITFKAFNGLPGVTISNFQLPSDDAAGGIHIETDANIPSPAQIGIDMGTATFQAYFKGVLLGPLSVGNLALKANSLTKAHLTGRILPQSADKLATIGELFSNFLQGQNQTLQTQGDSVVPSGTKDPVSWLSAAFKTLSFDVIFPGQKTQIIQSIELNDLEVVMKTQDQMDAPPASSQNTLAKYKNPFGFSLQVIEAGQTIVLGSKGVQMAKLVIPKMAVNGGVSTGNVVDLPISFKDIPLQSLNNAAFGSLFSAVTLTADVVVDVSGTADVVARTKIGDVPISGISIGVTSHLQGINSFGGTAVLSDVKVAGSGGNAGNEYMKVPLTTTLQNPSKVSLDTVSVSLPVNYKGVDIGRATISELPLVPGQNQVSAEFHYEPANANDSTAQSFLTDFIQTGDQLDLTIHGDSSSSPFGSLVPALSGLKLSSHLNGINQPKIITDIHVFISASTLITNQVSVDFGVDNPLDVPLIIEFVQSDAYVENDLYAKFSQPFGNFVVPARSTARSGTFDHVLLPKGALASLSIVALGYLDIRTAVTTRIGQGGYQVPFLKLSQDNVPTKYDISLF